MSDVEQLVSEFVNEGFVPDGMSYQELAEAFLSTRWLRDHDAEVRREGQAEGWGKAAEHRARCDTSPCIHNPYLHADTEEGER